MLCPGTSPYNSPSCIHAVMKSMELHSCTGWFDRGAARSRSSRKVLCIVKLRCSLQARAASSATLSAPDTTVNSGTALTEELASCFDRRLIAWKYIPGLDAAKTALRAALSCTNRGELATSSQRAQVEECQLSLEAFGARRDLDYALLAGKWRLIYTTAPDVVRNAFTNTKAYTSKTTTCSMNAHTGALFPDYVRYNI